MAFECASGDWVRKKDPETASFYYANVKTQSSSWTMPADWVEPARPSGVVVAPVEIWREVLDQTSGNIYYVNMLTLERSWIKPLVIESPPPLDLRKAPEFDSFPSEDLYFSSDDDFKSPPETRERSEVQKSPRSRHSAPYDFNTMSVPANPPASPSAGAFSPKLFFKSSELLTTPRLEQAISMSKSTAPSEKSGMAKAIKILLANEMAYFFDLQVIAMEFEATLANQKKATEKELLSTVELKMILKNMPDLFALHLRFTQDVSEFRTDAQILSPEFVEFLTQLVMSLEPYAFYVSAYKRDCKSVISFLEKVEVDRPYVKLALDHIRSTKCLTGTAKPIAYYLEAPASRPAAYGGLVYNVLKTVDPLSDAFKLWHDLLQKCEFVAQKIEENAHYISSRESVSDIQRRLHFAVGSEFQGLNLVTPSRYLVQSGEVRKKLDKARLGSSYKSYTLYVFNDLAMYTTVDKNRRIVPKHMLPMTDLKVEGSRKDVNFRLSSPAKSVQFKVGSREERDNWVKVLQECIKSCRDPPEMKPPVSRRESARKQSTSRTYDRDRGFETARKQSLSAFVDRDLVLPPPVYPELSEIHTSTERHAGDYDERRARLDRNDDVIKINVGGTVFQTSSATLLNKSNHTHDFLNNLVSKALAQDHPVFVDRDPDYFKVCLNYLRTGRLMLSAGLSPTMMSAELAHYGIAEPPVTSGRFQQWSQATTGDCRRFEFNRTHCDCFTSDGRFKVCDASRWQEPFEGLPWRGIECAPSVIFTEMGKYGWEIKGFSQNSNGGPGDVAFYVLQKTGSDTYQSSNDGQAARKTSLNLRGPRKPKPI